MSRYVILIAALLIGFALVVYQRRFGAILERFVRRLLPGSASRRLVRAASLSILVAFTSITVVILMTVVR